MTPTERRDIILESLRAQFAAKVAVVLLINGNSALGPALEPFLRDLANNVAQCFMFEDE